MIESTENVLPLPYELARPREQSSKPPEPAFAIRPGMTLAEAEKILIRQTLIHVTSKREDAARLLGISRRALQYKLKRYGLLDL
jgi:DNA-binding NtrC family response regulator